MSGPVPMCRNCAHGRWTMSRGGKLIRRNTSGQCVKAEQLRSIALRVVSAPAVSVLVAVLKVWPDAKAARCPMYEIKPLAVDGAPE